MPNPVRYAYYSFQAHATIGKPGSQTTTDIVGFQINHELNAIPTAQIKLPVGRSVSGTGNAAIHSLARSLSEQTPIQIWAEFIEVTRSDKKIRGLNIPKGPFKIFDGDTELSGYIRNEQGATVAYVINCNHWLGRLTRGSAFSQTSHPMNPSQYTYGQIEANAGDTGNQTRNWTLLSGASDIVTPNNLTADVWGQAIYPWFQRLAARDGFWSNEITLKGDPSNKAAQIALAKMGTKVTGYVASKPNNTIAIDTDIANEISKDIAISTQSGEFITHQTMWDILVGKICPDYLLAVVPRVEDALVVPYISGNRGTKGQPFETIRAEEYGGIQIDGICRRPLRAYGIQSSAADRFGANIGDDRPSAGVMGIGGWFDTMKEGSVIITMGPRWLGSILSPSEVAAEASGANQKPIGNAVFPGAGQTNDVAAKAKVRAAEVIKPLLNAYAQARYAQHMLAGRSATVAGPFRVDIAPGSLVQVDGASEAFIADQDQLAIPYFGDVLRVSMAADAETPYLLTAFHIGNIRTSVENQSDKTSIASHPLYANTFQGVTLLDGPNNKK